MMLFRLFYKAHCTIQAILQSINLHIILFLSDFITSGDFKIHYRDCERNETKLLREILIANDLFQIVSQPIHNANGTLDLVLINKAGLDLIGDGEVICSNEFSGHYIPFFV